MTEPFSSKLAFVLKALSMSRAQLAAEVGLDKSVVGRWITGAVQPSAHNLSRLSACLARRVPGFTSLDWDRSLGGLGALLGVAPVSAAAANGAGGGLPLPLLGQAVANTAVRGAAYEGFYRSTRPFGDRPGAFIRDHCMVRREEGGLLRLRLVTGDVFVEGWVLPLHDQLFIIGAEFADGGLVFALLNGVQGPRAQTLDGLILAPIRDAGRTPTASAIVLERIGDLTGDKAADEAHFAEFAGLDWIAPPEGVDEALRAYLTRDTGQGQLAAGGDWLLRMPAARSLSRADTAG